MIGRGEYKIRGNHLDGIEDLFSVQYLDSLCSAADGLVVGSTSVRAVNFIWGDLWEQSRASWIFFNVLQNGESCHELTFVNNRCQNLTQYVTLWHLYKFVSLSGQMSCLTDVTLKLSHRCEDKMSIAVKFSLNVILTAVNCQFFRWDRG